MSTRVGLTPDNVRSYVNAGHQVYIERNAGVGSGFMTDDYIKAGATILETAREVWETAEMIVKVKEPLPDEYQYFRKGADHLHLPASGGGPRADRRDVGRRRQGRGL